MARTRRHARRASPDPRSRLTGRPWRPTTLFDLDQERGTSRIRFAFAGDKVRTLDLQGPPTLATALAMPGTDGTLLRFAWQGQQPEPIGLVRGDDGQVTGLRLGDATYRRRP